MPLFAAWVSLLTGVVVFFGVLAIGQIWIERAPTDLREWINAR